MGDVANPPEGAFYIRKPVACVPLQEYEEMIEKIQILSSENKSLRRQVVQLKRGGRPNESDDDDVPKPPAGPPPRATKASPKTLSKGDFLASEEDCKPPLVVPLKGKTPDRKASSVDRRDGKRGTRAKEEATTDDESESDDRRRPKKRSSGTRNDRQRADTRERTSRSISRRRRRSERRREEDNSRRQRDRSERRSERRTSDDKRRRKRSISPVKEAQSEDKRRRKRSLSSVKERGRATEKAEKVEKADVPFSFNALQVKSRIEEIYNQKIPNNIGMEKRGVLVKEKMKNFFEVLDDGIEIVDIKSGKVNLHPKDVRDRYECVFRESGTGLKVSVSKRFFIDAKNGGSGSTYCLDFERHENIVTPQPGTRKDGSLGVLNPRTQDLIVLYHVRENKVQRMWMFPDIDGELGKDPEMNKAKLTQNPLIQMFFKKLEALTKGKEMETHFHNYLTEEKVIG